MEAVGNLTGGLAHDFNNLLGVIIGNIELVRESVQDDHELDEASGDALAAAQRGADLVRRLLAFARRQPLQPQTTDANGLIGGIVKLLRRTLGEQIEFKLALAADLWPIRVDPTQLEAAITNLATNARDAMPKGGLLTLVTENVQLDGDNKAMNWEAAPGDYVRIDVADTGCGMAPDMVGHIFEPFFTTKEEGKGSGLGLSMVFGFIKQSGGHVTVSSEPGRGATFNLYLPRAEANPAQSSETTIVSAPTGGRETILVVEDNKMMRQVVVRQLNGLGYRTIEAENAAAAIEILSGDPTIDLLFTDVVMPGTMDGFELAEAAEAMRPGLKMLLTSGFPETRLAAPGVPVSGNRLLSKPYSKKARARAVRETLDGAALSARSPEEAPIQLK
jgi:CheY-like chemotaxis protein